MARSTHSKSGNSRMTVDDLPAHVISSERVMFSEGVRGGGVLVTDGDASPERAARLSQLLGWKISLQRLDQAPEDVRNAFPVIVGMCSTTKKAVGGTLIPPEEGPTL